VFPRLALRKLLLHKGATVALSHPQYKEVNERKIPHATRWSGL